jgi:23S rRNA (cytidine1920-2'-O)/16S rRNA (cytidine1409-2'-O)-methyltransferase
MAGEVLVNGQPVTQPSRKAAIDVTLELKSPPRYVSRGGEKLAAALDAFALDDLEGRICADVGASTGGFTDCLLQHGATRVYAIDVGYGQLDWRLRQDPRVVSLERTNARYLEKLPEPVSFVTVDASFISLRLLLPVIAGWFPAEGGGAVALIKPQFEAGREEADRGKGVIRDPGVHARVLQEVLEFAGSLDFQPLGLIASPILGPKGNREFLAYLGYATSAVEVPLAALIAAVLDERAG